MRVLRVRDGCGTFDADARQVTAGEDPLGCLSLRHRERA